MLYYASLQINPNFMRFIFLFFIAFIHGCSTPDINLPKIYKVEIQQGNEIDSQMLLKLKPGMTKAQVKFILGTPLIADSFHKNRWDYLFVLRNNETNKENIFSEKRHVVLNFKDELLENITGEVISKKSNQKINKDGKFDEYIIKPNTSANEDGESDVSWTDKLKFWDSSKDKNMQPTIIDKNKIDQTKDQGDSINNKNNGQQKIKIKKDNEDIAIDTKESIKKIIHDDINNENQTSVDKKMTNEPAKLKQDIIKTETETETETENKDYFDIMLEKIGF